MLESGVETESTSGWNQSKVDNSLIVLSKSERGTNSETFES